MVPRSSTDSALSRNCAIFPATPWCEKISRRSNLFSELEEFSGVLCCWNFHIVLIVWSVQSNILFSSSHTYSFPFHLPKSFSNLVPTFNKRPHNTIILLSLLCRFEGITSSLPIAWQLNLSPFWWFEMNIFWFRKATRFNLSTFKELVWWSK